MNILEKIVDTKRQEVARAKQQKPLEELKERIAGTGKSLKNAILTGSGIIAEFKRKSPSKGWIAQSAESSVIAQAYERGGADAVSVLTDTEYFGGSPQDLKSVRQSVSLPLLRKDFMIDPYQFYEARAWGADAVLLIAACLSPVQVADFTNLAHRLGLEVLLEIHSEEELGHCTTAVDLIGINNRNLRDFKVNLDHSVRLREALPSGIPAIAESGIYTPEDYHFLKDRGFDGFLMGEYFMRQSDPEQALKSLLQ